MTLLLVIVASLAIGGLIVAFLYGLIRGPGLASPGSGQGESSMRPLGRVADIYVGYFMLAIVFIAWRLKDGAFGNGPNGEACFDTGITGVPPRAELWRTRPGTALPMAGDLVGCVAHPTAGQWALFTLTQLPGLLLWAGVLLMILRLVRHAAQHGPFTPRAAGLMFQLGWLIIAGCVVVGILTGLSTSLLANMVITPRPYDPVIVVLNAVLEEPLRVLLPVPALAGAALLSFGRVTRAGAVMDEELRATV